MIADGIERALEKYHPVLLEIVAQALAHDRKKKASGETGKEITKEITKLRSEYDLRIAALLQKTEKLERGLVGDRDVLDLRSPGHRYDA